jgi:Superinfection immunity protein
LTQVVIQQGVRPLEHGLGGPDPSAIANVFFWGFVLAFAVFIYAVPIIVAHSRHHHQRGAITVLTLLLGWTALGSIIAMVWACTATLPVLERTAVVRDRTDVDRADVGGKPISPAVAIAIAIGVVGILVLIL